MSIRKSNQLAISGILTAIGASLCCITPVLAFIAGISGSAAAFSWLEPVRPYFAAFTLLVLGFAWYQKLRPHGKLRKQQDIDCACEPEARSSFWQSKKFLGIVTVFAGAMLAFPYYAEVFYPSNDVGEVMIVANETETAHIPVRGMTCQGCAAHVENEVNKLPGIISVAASYEQANAEIAYDKTRVNLGDIEAAINATGYKVVKDQR